MTDQAQRLAAFVAACGRSFRRLAGAVARALPSHSPRSRVVRALLALIALGGAAWFAVIAVRAGAVALGFAPTHGFARALAVLILAPVAAAFVVPTLDAYLVLALGNDRPGSWSRILTEASAALIVACFATVLDARLWPGIAVLAFVAVLGALYGLRRWRPAEVGSERQAEPPMLLLLLDDTGAAQRAARPVVRPVPFERKAA